MSKVNLERVKQMIKQLPLEDRQQLVPFLAEFSDSDIHSYDLREELEVLKTHGKRLTGPNDDLDYYLVNLVFVRNLVSVQILDTEVLRAVFLPDNFIQSFPKSGKKISKVADSFKEKYFTKERLEAIRSERRAQGIQESDAEFDAVITEACYELGESWVIEKAKRMAEQISLHLPGMVGDMFCAAIQGEAFFDFNKLSEELGREDKKLSTEQIKKMLLTSYWRGIKPHLGVTQGGNKRTDAAWQGDEVLIRYAHKVNDRRLLAESIKGMYEDCLGAEGWIEDLNQDSSFQKLSQDVSDEIINWAARRAASDETIPNREREPLSIACEMARRELDLPEQDIETLRSYYSKGKKLIQQNRNNRGK